jgi:Family of unknown function (DUF5758)/Pentapeptide repeats (8 copies)
MTTLTSDQLKTILAQHKLWRETNGAQGVRANLARANLAHADLAHANLADANLADAYLAGAYLAGANLAGAYLAGANLADANLAGADLARANLARANLADANLAGADLADAYLTGANLAGANLADAKINEKTKMPPISILADGTLVGWKKLQGAIIAKLEIPARAQRVNSTGRKCRAEFAKVLALYRAGEDKPLPKIAIGIANHDRKTQYKTGKTVRPDAYDPDFRVECSHGIHFFITRAEAEAY